MWAWFMSASLTIKMSIIAGVVAVSGAAVAVPVAISNSSSVLTVSAPTGTAGTNKKTPTGQTSESTKPSETPSSGPSSPSPSSSPSTSRNQQNPNNSVTPQAPSAPRSLAVSNASGASVNLAWTAPSNSGSQSISGYNVYFSSDGGGSWANAGNTSSRSFTVSGLGPNSNYVYVVEAYSSAGTGPLSNIAASSTGTFVPDAPTNFQGYQGAGGDNIVNGVVVYQQTNWFRFVAPGNQGASPISGYEIGYSLNDGASWTWISVEGSNGQTGPRVDISWPVDTPGNSNTIRWTVRAVNAYGSSPMSNQDAWDYRS